MRRLHPSRVTALVADRPAFLFVIITALALVLAAAWFVASRDALGLSSRNSAAPATAVASPNGTRFIAPDVASEPWHLEAPEPMPAPPPAAVATDWVALSMPVADAKPVAAPEVSLASDPSGFDVALSGRERRALIATAREAEGLPSPKGYRPGIAIIVPGGSVSDGVCR